MASSSAAQDLDEKSLMSFMDDAIDLDCSSEWGDEGKGSSGPPSSILQVAQPSPSSPPSSRQQPPASIRSSNYKATSHSSSSLTTTASTSASVSSASASSRKLPDIALDLSGSPGPLGSSSGSPPSGGHYGTNSISLPSPSSSSPQHHAEAKKNRSSWRLWRSA